MPIGENHPSFTIQTQREFVANSTMRATYGFGSVRKKLVARFAEVLWLVDESILGEVNYQQPEFEVTANKSYRDLRYLAIGMILGGSLASLILTLGSNSGDPRDPLVLSRSEGYPYDAKREQRDDGSSRWSFDVARKDMPGPNVGMDTTFFTPEAFRYLRFTIEFLPDPYNCDLDFIWNVRSTASGVVEAEGRLSLTDSAKVVDLTLGQMTREFSIIGRFDWKLNLPASPEDGPPCKEAWLIITFNPIYRA